MKIEYSQDIQLTEIDKHIVKKILKLYFCDIQNNQTFIIEEEGYVIIGEKENDILKIQRIHKNVHSLND